MVSKKRLGDLLVEEGLITESQLKQALAQQSPTKRLGQILQEMDLLTEQEVVDTLSQQLDIPCMNSDMFLIDPKVVEYVPEPIARRHNIIPLFLVGEELTVATSDPLDLMAIDELRQKSGYRINFVLSTASSIMRALDEYYSLGHSIKEVIESFDSDLPGMEKDSAPAVRLVNQILFQAVQLSASDIHIEHGESECRVRFRVDGVLHEILNPPKYLGSSITSRLKIMAHLDISEKRLPQDGRMSITVGQRTVDMRVSTLPTAYGEKIVMRILDKSSLQISLDKIGLEEEEEAMVHSILKNPYGLLLVTGPTGSGKTTTLYSFLDALNSPEKNVITVEDPVEYKFDDINQMQVNPKVNLTFSRGLRAILRQDPDVIMVGEIRDEETASIAIRSALTGHFVLSTLHTNDTIGTIGRMIDMGIQPYLLASSLVGIIAQRLVRKVCVECVEFGDPTPHQLESMGLEKNAVNKWAVPQGCSLCNFTGFKSRTAIFEILPIDDEIRTMILSAHSSVEIRRSALERGLKTLRTIGLQKVLNGITTLQEVERVTAMIEE
ncbi:type II secretion system protein GspE [bacterium]|nr:type II secretion system protein GspE [bacterium]